MTTSSLVKTIITHAATTVIFLVFFMGAMSFKERGDSLSNHRLSHTEISVKGTLSANVDTTIDALNCGLVNADIYNKL